MIEAMLETKKNTKICPYFQVHRSFELSIIGLLILILMVLTCGFLFGLIFGLLDMSGIIKSGIFLIF